MRLKKIIGCTFFHFCTVVDELNFFYKILSLHFNGPLRDFTPLRARYLVKKIIRAFEEWTKVAGRTLQRAEWPFLC